MTGWYELEAGHTDKWFRNDTVIAFFLALLGALIYGVTVLHHDYFRNMQRGDNGQVAIQMLDEMRRPFLTLRKAEVRLLQPNDEASAISDIESAVYDGRRLLSKYLEFATYNAELEQKVMQLKVSYESWVSLELELVKKKAVLAEEPGNRMVHAELNLLVPRIISAFLTVMDVLGDGEKPIHEDIKIGADAVRGLLVSTLVFIAYLICLAFWREWMFVRRLRKNYDTMLQLYHLSRTDSLTGLANRVMLEDRLSVAIAEARRYGH